MESTPAAAPLRPASSRTSLRPPSNSGRRRLPSSTTKAISKSTAQLTTTGPAPPEVISSLIRSLSAISAPVESHFDNLPSIDDSPAQNEARISARPSRQTLRSDKRAGSKSSVPQHGFGMDYGAYKRPDDINSAEDDSEEESAAVPPVVRMAPPRAAHSKSPSRRHGMLGLRSSLSSLGRRQSQQSLAGANDSASIGIPVERLHNGSTSSLASSTEGTPNHQDFALRKSREALVERVNGVPLREDLNPVRSRQSLKAASQERAERDTSPQSADLVQTGTPRNSGLSTAGPISSISPGGSHNASAPTGGLKNTLIPSRRSSLRHSVSESITLHELRQSTNLEDLAIDQDLIEEDHSTVRRIRELQEARDKRQKEWRKDSRRSDKAKRHSLSGASPRILRQTSSRQSSHPSIAEEIVLRSESGVGPTAPGPSTRTRYDDFPRSDAEGFTSLAPVSTPPRGSSRPLDVRPSTSGGGRPNRDSMSPQKSSWKALDGGTQSLTAEGLHIHPAESIDAEVDAFLQSPRLTQKIRHPRTGRVIAFSEVGDPNGFAVICCVGMGLTRYLPAFYDELARTLKLRLITPDRPGVGESQPCLDGTGMPLNWPDDVELICDHLGVLKFSLLAHSAGALYALAAALRLPQRIRGRVHLLAPWITPSQMSSTGYAKEFYPAANVPFSQKLLGILPASFLKAANASFFGAASASIHKYPKPNPTRRSLTLARSKSPFSDDSGTADMPTSPTKPAALSCYQATTTALVSQGVIAPSRPNSGIQTQTERPITTHTRNSSFRKSPTPSPTTLTDSQHRLAYDSALTARIWALATLNANPAVDLIICLEKHAPIAFFYTDITRACVIHHGSRDTRVPVDNVRWLAGKMKRCELRVLEGEGHGLMASAGVMASILGEISGEWEEWKMVVSGKKGVRKGMQGPEVLGNGSAYADWDDDEWE